MSDVPPLVRRAVAGAAAAGAEHSCRDGDGRLRHVLAARRGLLRVATIGTGAGVGAAWVVAALAPQVPFVAVEPDEGAARLARDVLSEDEGVRILVGRWEELLPPESPFDLVVADASSVAAGDPALTGLLTPGGTVLVDGLGGGEAALDPAWAAWLAHPALAAVLVRTGADAGALVATRTR